MTAGSMLTGVCSLVVAIPLQGNDAVVLSLVLQLQSRQCVAEERVHLVQAGFGGWDTARHVAGDDASRESRCHVLEPLCKASMECEETRLDTPVKAGLSRHWRASQLTDELLSNVGVCDVCPGVILHDLLGHNG